MVEVFKTTVSCQEDASHLIHLLTTHFPHYAINFDLEDCDRILRIQTEDKKIKIKDVMRMMRRQGFHCEVLEH